MIGYLEGVITHRLDDTVLLRTSGGVGYQVHVPAGVMAALAPGMSADGAQVALFVSTIVRDNDLALYGFDALEGKRLFEALLRASGIGPKLALSFLSAFSPKELRQAIIQQDVTLLSTIPGVGKKTASRLCLELSDKIGAGAEETPREGGPGGQGELISALTNLGFPEKDVVPLVRRMPMEGGDFSEQLRQALSMLGKQ